ncbi:glycosyl hydrolase 53 family protein [Lederbergia panacisoli]|uniref:glycosyl hydrolase 53 family protein n=1 Tax=Lederbergia panacisoli TaxID=1255251 RepID=UPI00214CE6BC|nr:glycosyl hydrolase 53 family protein [Lederbergia panacisoli]MCR2822343.1 glycosyl hydrolase 53 family protein [Lederbergia panacisoli]
MKKRNIIKFSISFLVVMLVISVTFMSLPAHAYHGTANITPAVTNLTSKNWVSVQAGTGDARLAMDQDENTYWDATIVSDQSWIEFDLGGKYPGMRKIEVIFPSKNGKYQYKLEASEEGENWFTLSDHSKEAIIGGEDILIKDTPAIRYLKATLLGVSNGAIAGISEIRINNYILKENLTVGADISYDTLYLNRKYTTSNNSNFPSSDGRMIGTMQETGMSSVRFRIWNDPRNEGTGNPVTNLDGSMSPEDTLNKSLYANGLGMKVGLDFHYSDSWADPGKQVKPKAWKDLNFEHLLDAVYDFTYEVTESHVKSGVVPDYVQVGNEIINGMMWGNEKVATGNEPNYAKNDRSYFANSGGELLWEYWGSEDPEKQAAYNASWNRFAALVDAGLRAVKEASPTSKTKIHVIVDANRLPKTQEFWRQLTTRLKEDFNNDFDIMSISYYPEWHGTMEALSEYLHAFATEFPEYELAVSETAHPASGGTSKTGYPYSIQGQADFMKDVMRACNDTINASCSTMLVWEPVMWQTMFTRIGNTQFYQANDSTRVFHEAFSENIQKSNHYLSTKLYTVPILPEFTEVLDIENNVIKKAKVSWDSISKEAYSNLGYSTVKGTTEFGEVIAHISVDIDISVIENLLNEYITSGEVSGPLVSQLENMLKQANHHLNKGSQKDAIKFIEQFLFHLNRSANEKNVSINAKESLYNHAQLLLEIMKK